MYLIAAVLYLMAGATLFVAFCSKPDVGFPGRHEWTTTVLLTLLCMVAWPILLLIAYTTDVS